MMAPRSNQGFKLDYLFLKESAKSVLTTLNCSVLTNYIFCYQKFSNLRQNCVIIYFPSPSSSLQPTVRLLITGEKLQKHSLTSSSLVENMFLLLFQHLQNVTSDLKMNFGAFDQTSVLFYVLQLQTSGLRCIMSIMVTGLYIFLLTGLVDKNRHS